MDKGKNSQASNLSYLAITLFQLFMLFYSAPYSIAATITSDQLDYYPDDGIYIAAGNIKIEKDDLTITADKLVFNELTSEADAEGKIIFQDKDVTITAKKAEINIDSKTGNIYDAVIFFKKDNYWITGNSISKTGERSYYASNATFTTCNAEPYLTPEKFPIDYPKHPADITIAAFDWCFQGRDVHIEVGKTLTAKDVAYRIKGLPVIYSPYILTPFLSERQTGFLTPVVGTSSKKGFQFSPAFYWEIDEDKDATFYMDYMSRRGFGKGIEFRYMDSTGIGEWQAYHLRDKKFDKDFFAFRIEDRFQLDNIKGFASFNYINDADFYKEYGYNTQGRITNLKGIADINRFFQSSAEFYLPLQNSRLYLLSQYWIDLKDKKAHPIQRLPELGYVIHPTRVGPFVLTFASSITNFYTEKETKGQRLVLNPSISHSFGDSIRFFQSASLIQAFYNLSSYSVDDSIYNKGIFEYRANALTRFYKFYTSFVHDIELSLGYKFISDANHKAVFDFTELLSKTSQVELSIYNSIRAKDLFAAVRLTQPYSLNHLPDQRNLLPAIIDVIVSSQPFILRIETAYDFNKNNAKRLSSMINVRVSDKTTIFAGERYDKTNEIKFFSLGFESALSQRVAVGANISYDARGKGLRESSIKTLYRQQCWALNAIFSRKPSDLTRPAEYNVSLIFELTGIGKLRTL